MAVAMKVCTKCLRELQEESFRRNRNVCRECDKRRSLKYYRENRDIVLGRKRQDKARRRASARSGVIQYLIEHPCVDCGEKDIVVLEFDHIRDKSVNISHMLKNSVSFNSILKEIEKCEVRCSNCHARKTAKDQGWYTHQAKTGASISNHIFNQIL